MSDYVLAKKLQANLPEILDKGFTFTQIIPPMNYINRYAESLQFWLPLYATGKTNAYYYPRLRGNLYRHSIIVVPGCCVQYASAVGLGNTSEVTMFSTDPKLVDAFERQFQEHIAMCRPAVKAYTDYKDSLSCLEKYNNSQGTKIQLINSLSIASMSEDLLYHFKQCSDNIIVQDAFQLFIDALPVFERHLAQEQYVDMCLLPSLEDICSGTVPTISPFVDDDVHQPFYTVETYRLHLENLVHLMEEYENYCFLPLSKKDVPPFYLLTAEDGLALIIRSVKPFMAMEIQRKSLVTAFQEHLFRQAEAIGYTGTRREKILMELRTLIQKLTNLSRS